MPGPDMAARVQELRARRPELFSPPAPPVDEAAEQRRLADLARRRLVHSHPGWQAWLDAMTEKQAKAQQNFLTLREKALPSKLSTGEKVLTAEELAIVREQIAELRGYLAGVGDAIGAVPPVEDAEEPHPNSAKQEKRDG